MSRYDRDEGPDEICDSSVAVQQNLPADKRSRRPEARVEAAELRPTSLQDTRFDPARLATPLRVGERNISILIATAATLSAILS